MTTRENDVTCSCVFFQFGNLPYGFRANTWVVPPVVADNPSVFPPLPVEDENWGGNGGGQGRDGKHDCRQWAKEFSILAAMPCKTSEQRQIRDRKAFLLHSLFVDVSVFKAVATIRDLIDSSECSLKDSTSSILHQEKLGDLIIKVTRDVPDASTKLDCKNDGSQVLGVSQEELAQRNLLKGITADESATVHVSEYSRKNTLKSLKLLPLGNLVINISTYEVAPPLSLAFKMNKK